jgi:hypothetical protein
MEIGVELARRPESRAKLSASKQGKVLSPTHKIHLFAGAKARRKERFKARQAAFWRTGRFPKVARSDPWIPEEEELLAKHSTAELVRIIGRTRKGIMARRLHLGIRPPPRRSRSSMDGIGG